MSADDSRPGASRPKQITRVDLPPGPAAAFRDALYSLYLRSGSLTLDEIVRRVHAADSDDPDVFGVPGRDTIHKMISGRALPSNLFDAVTVARLLARAAGVDPDEADQQIRQLFVAARMPPRRLGRPIGDCDPIELGVHRAITMSGHDGLPVVPPYLRREHHHDGRLATVVEEVLGGHSRIVTLVGESATGKTRACWEAVQALAQRPESWRLWHPIEPSSSSDDAAALADVGPRTVVWLDEAQRYLLPPDAKLGEQVAVGLRTLLGDPGRRPVLVLATMWRQYWATATTSPRRGEPDLYPQARQLLTGSAIPVPDAFGGTDLRASRAVCVLDPRLRYASEQAPNGRVIQVLAGVPALLDRYRNPETPAAQAVMYAAVDARRLGHPRAIPRTFLAYAAPGYLDDHQWEQAGDDWLERALAFTAEPCHGTPGPLTRIRPRPGQPADVGGQPSYQLAHYLEQTGRTGRAGVVPPAGFWLAAARCIEDPAILRRFGEEAHRRGRYQHAVRLYARAAGLGDRHAATVLNGLTEQATSQDAAKAPTHLVTDAGYSDPVHFAVTMVIATLQPPADPEHEEAVARQATDRGDHPPLINLIYKRLRAGERASAYEAARYAADRGIPNLLATLAKDELESGDPDAARHLYEQAIDYGVISALEPLAALWERTGDGGRARRLRRFGLDDHGSPATALDLDS